MRSDFSLNLLVLLLEILILSRTPHDYSSNINNDLRGIAPSMLPVSTTIVVVVVVLTLKAVPISTQYFLTSVLVQLMRTPSVVTG